MTKLKSTKNAFFGSAIALLLCVAMLIGSTFAWFTDSATTGVNTIQAGNLDIDLYKGTVAEGKISYTEIVDKTTKLFNDAALWEPGYTEVAYIKVANNGTLALKALLTVNFSKQVEGKNMAGEIFKLSDYLMYDLIEINSTDFYADRDAARDAAEAGAKKIATEQNEIHMTAGTETTPSEKYYALVVYMPENVGNEANYRDKKPSINLGVTLLATQDTVEIDSWDNLYDFDAAYDNSPENNEGLYEALESSDNVTIKNGNYKLPINVPEGKTVNVEGGDFAVTSVVAGAAFDVGKNANLTISSSEVTATEHALAFALQEGGDLTINAGTYSSSQIQVIQIRGDDKATLSINGGSIKGTAGIWCDNKNAVIVITGGEFNVWTLAMGDNIPTTPVKITGGKFEIGAGGFDASQGTPFVITGGTFSKNPSKYVDTTAYDVTKSADDWYTVTAK